MKQLKQLQHLILILIYEIIIQTTYITIIFFALYQ